MTNMLDMIRKTFLLKIVTTLGRALGYSKTFGKPKMRSNKNVRSLKTFGQTFEKTFG